MRVAATGAMCLKERLRAAHRELDKENLSRTPEQLRAVTFKPPTVAEVCARAGVALSDVARDPDAPFAAVPFTRINAALPPPQPALPPIRKLAPDRILIAPPPTLGADASTSTPVALGGLIIEEICEAHHGSAPMETDAHDVDNSAALSGTITACAITVCLCCASGRQNLPLHCRTNDVLCTRSVVRT